MSSANTSQPALPIEQKEHKSASMLNDGTRSIHTEETASPTVETVPVPEEAPRGVQFWLIMVSLMVATFLSALDLTSVSTALPLIVKDLHSTEFIFGRRPTVPGSLIFFAVGSAFSAAAQNMNMLITGRTLQGVGGGGILSLTEIIVADLVPLRLRQCSALSGPLLLQSDLRSAVFSQSTTGGGFSVLVPLILGLLGLVAFMVWETKWASEPVVPWQLVNNRTSLFGYITVFIDGITSTATLFYFPVYFQGAQLRKPIQSGVSLFGVAFTLTFKTMNIYPVCGILVARFNRYIPQNLAGWAFSIIGFGLMSMITVSSPKGWQIGFQIICGIGLGLLYAGPTFPVLAPLPTSEAAHALALFAFVRNFAQTFGVTIGSTILQNSLKQKLPAAFMETVSSQGAEIAYSIIPVVGSLSESLQSQVQDAFAGSVQVIWRVMIGLSAAGLVCVLMMHEMTDKDWGLAERQARAEWNREKV
ncbi:hypothetical protein FRB96_009027 [Tulasnella sp. 330]|nr:hypothetical protein FRB96_009027 [Tulasnella sp. 330]